MLCRDLVGRYFFSPCHGDSLGTAFRYFNDKASARFVELKTHKINLFGVKPTEVRKCPSETSLSKFRNNYIFFRAAIISSRVGIFMALVCLDILGGRAPRCSSWVW